MTPTAKAPAPLPETRKLRLPARPIDQRLSVAVTGADGLLGAAICRRLARDRHRVVALTRRAANVSGAACNRATPDFVAAAPELVAGCAVVVNCAARVHVTGREDPTAALAAYRSTNVELPLALATAARDDGAIRFVQISSVAAVASASPHDRSLNDCDPARPTTPYGMTKLEADVALGEMATADFATVSLRPPALFGPGVGAWFAKLLAAAKHGLPLPLGAIHNRRSFAFVDNIADAVATSLSKAPPARATVHIVTDSAPVSTAELYRRLLALHGKSNRIVTLPEELVRLLGGLVLGERVDSLIGDAAYDGAAFARSYGWRPPIGFDEALRRTVAARP